MIPGALVGRQASGVGTAEYEAACERGSYKKVRLVHRVSRGEVPGQTARQVRRQCSPSAARRSWGPSRRQAELPCGVAEGGEDPWLYGPGFRRVCLCRGMVEPELPRGTDAVKHVGQECFFWNSSHRPSPWMYAIALRRPMRPYATTLALSMLLTYNGSTNPPNCPAPWMRSSRFVRQVALRRVRYGSRCLH
jgi:hypothetical protein